MDMDLYLDNFNEEEDIDFLGIDFLLPEQDEKLENPRKNRKDDDNTEDYGVIQPQRLSKNSNSNSRNQTPNSPAQFNEGEGEISRPGVSKPVSIAVGRNSDSTLSNSSGSYSSFGKGSFESPLFAFYKENSNQTSKSYQPKSNFNLNSFRNSQKLNKTFSTTGLGNNNSFSLFSSSWNPPRLSNSNTGMFDTDNDSTGKTVSGTDKKKKKSSKSINSGSSKKNGTTKMVWGKFASKKTVSVVSSPELSGKKHVKGTHINTSSDTTTTNNKNSNNPSRTLFVRNISSYVEDHTLRKVFEKFGQIKSLYSQCKHRGFVMISYFDVRDAKKAKENLTNCIIQKRKIDVHYSIPKQGNSTNNDTTKENFGILHFKRFPENLTENDLLLMAKKYGDVESVDLHKRIVSYYNLKHSEKAYDALNGWIYKGVKLDVNFIVPKMENLAVSKPLPISSSFKYKKSSSQLSSSYNPNSSSSGKLSKYFSSNNSKQSHHNNHRQSTNNNNNNNIKFQTRRRYRSSATRDRKSYVDRSNFVINLERVKAGKDKRTTLMIRNIPNKYNRKMLMTTIDKKFKEKYNFLYLPIDFQNKCNMGYAFINMVHPKTIPDLCKEFMGQKWEKFNSEKICELTYARIQGKEKLAEHFKNSSVNYMEKSVKPVFY